MIREACRFIDPVSSARQIGFDSKRHSSSLRFLAEAACIQACQRLPKPHSVNVKMHNQKPAAAVPDPNHMLNTLLSAMHLEDDEALARKLDIAPRMLTMMREGRLMISPSMLMWMNEVSGISVNTLREILKKDQPGMAPPGDPGHKPGI